MALKESRPVLFFGLILGLAYIGYASLKASQRNEARDPVPQRIVPSQFIANADQANSDYILLPFFYSMGAWPKSWLGTPSVGAYYYQQGIKNQFLGRIDIHWNHPAIRIILTGPKTLQSEKISITELQRCFTDPPTLKKISCLLMRNEWLAKVNPRPFIESKEVTAGMKSIEWINFSNAAISPELRTQGLHITYYGPALKPSYIEDRYILINANASTQMYSLVRPATAEGEIAQENFTKLMASVRMSATPSEGKEWIATRIKAAAKKAASTEKSVASLLETQLLLLSQLSLDPRDINAHYFYARIAIDLLTLNPNLRTLHTQQIESAVKSLKELAPTDQKTLSLSNFLDKLEIQNNR